MEMMSVSAAAKRRTLPTQGYSAVGCRFIFHVIDGCTGLSTNEIGRGSGQARVAQEKSSGNTFGYRVRFLTLFFPCLIRMLSARGDRWSHAPPVPKTEWPAHDSTDAPCLVGSWEKGSRGRAKPGRGRSVRINFNHRPALPTGQMLRRRSELWQEPGRYDEAPATAGRRRRKAGRRRGSPRQSFRGRVRRELPSR